MASPMSGQGKPNPASVVIGCPSGLVHPGFTSCARHSVLFSYNKTLINQACSVQVAGYWIRAWASTSSRSMNTHAHTAIFTLCLANDPLFYRVLLQVHYFMYSP